MTKQIQRGDNIPNSAPYQLFLPMDVGVKIEADEAVRLQNANFTALYCTCQSLRNFLETL